MNPIRDLVAARRQSASLEDTAHRPWDLPDRTWLQGQTWLDLLFAHWRVDLELVRRVVPPQLELDLVDGTAWVAVTPFEVRALRPRFAPPAPFLSAFPELNVRTYVTVGGKPGIYFFGLDAASRFAVAMARRTYRLPYFRAHMAIEREAGGIRYRSERVDGPPAELRAAYAPRGPSFNAPPGSTEAALVERYCAYTLDEHGTVNRAEIHHPPWELRIAEAEFEINTMAAHVGLPLEGEPMLHFAARQDVVLWALEPVTAP